MSTTQKIDNIINNPTIRDLVDALSFDGADQQRLFDAAKERKPNEVYIRSVIELSNHCRQHCAYCGMRAENRLLERFRIAGSDLSQLVSASINIPEISFVHFSFGEDPRYNFDELATEISRIYDSGKEVTLVLGELNEKTYKKLYDAAQGGNIRYTIKLETTDPELFSRIKPNHSFAERLGRLKMVHEIGFQPCSGVIVGLPGQTPEMLAKDILFLRNMPELANVSASNFTPSPGSLLEKESPASISQTLSLLALLRLTSQNPDVTIPASGSLGKEGQKIALRHFANQLSIHMIPDDVKDKYLIYDGGQRILGKKEEVLALIERTGGTLAALNKENGVKGELPNEDSGVTFG